MLTIRDFVLWNLDMALNLDVVPRTGHSSFYRVFLFGSDCGASSGAIRQKFGRSSLVRRHSIFGETEPFFQSDASLHCYFRSLKRRSLLFGADKFELNLAPNFKMAQRASIVGEKSRRFSGGLGRVCYCYGFCLCPLDKFQWLLLGPTNGATLRHFLAAFTRWRTRGVLLSLIYLYLVAITHSTVLNVRKLRGS